MSDKKRLDDLCAIRANDPSMLAPVAGREYPKFKVGDRVLAHGFAGAIVGEALYRDTHPDTHTREISKSQQGRATPIHDELKLFEVLLDGEKVPRRFFVSELGEAT